MQPGDVTGGGAPRKNQYYRKNNQLSHDTNSLLPGVFVAGE